MRETKMLVFAVLLTVTAIYMSPDGFYGRWCSAYPEFCDPVGEQYANNKND